MKTLHLTLKKKWFDMILSGEKKEEYREIKVYWVKRLIGNIWTSKEDFEYWLNNLPEYATLQHVLNNYDTITFKNGYSKNAPEMVVRLKKITVEYGVEKWGAIPDTNYFVFQLGEILSTKNI
jgi:hypothetical protein